MRRVLLSLLSLLILAAVTVAALSIPAPPERHSNAPIVPSPTATLPACVTEDGAGQALCWWNAQAQGNGMGTSVVSGDCAYEDEMLRGICASLHMRNSQTINHSDGSSTTIPNGVDLVGECQAEFKGQELRDCFTAWM